MIIDGNNDETVAYCTNILCPSSALSRKANRQVKEINKRFNEFDYIALVANCTLIPFRNIK